MTRSTPRLFLRHLRELGVDLAPKEPGAEIRPRKLFRALSRRGFEIEQTKDNGYQLVMKTPKGDTQNIAPFEDKNAALRALMATSDAMEHAHKVQVANDSTQAAPVARKGKLASAMPGLIGVFILGILIFMLVNAGPKISQAQWDSEQQTTSSDGRNVGSPMSADDFLRR